MSSIEAAEVTANGKPTEPPIPVSANPTKASHKSSAVTKITNPNIDKITKTYATNIVPSLIFKLSPKKRPNAMSAANNPKP